MYAFSFSFRLHGFVLVLGEASVLFDHIKGPVVSV